MRQDWIKRERSRDLIIYALGWGCEPGIVSHIPSEGFDILTVYDYRGVEQLDPEAAKGYLRVYLFAWSFGVWAAERIIGDIPIYRAVALNGTPKPVDDIYGIPCRAFDMTVRGFRRAGLDGFFRRAYGASYDMAAAIHASRDTEAMIAELEYLGEESSRPYEPRIQWYKAIIGSSDEIFPPANMAAYWGDKAVTIEGMPHYPFAEAHIITDELKK